ncbi:tRNA (guanosine(46)-N7)-methyltransferase TrmB [Mycoplasmopsis meleagridis]|uniref:tRNA (guanosine(46)-N7)-methyltransferase TrmB n=1 Tax=Mycoplasmopsis meleagridis TaxID=29561 RepID=UPI00073D8531|nr:tRNA (guanosine(46)-N7)-methyltransferase TrmB [Mycoplasmopsis meleagridis]KUH47635.1 tRNA (guanine-N7)-methyltransferase [Mycoplasmopsis meleagridis]
MRLRNDRNSEENIKKTKYWYSPDNYPIILNKESIIEIGMGKGEMLTRMANENPNMIFYGLEKYPTVAYKAVKKAEKLNLNNFFIILDDAKNLNNIFNNYANTIWLTFSDPWPKARHEKRRLTYKTYLDEYEKIMDNDSILIFKSDNDKLYEYSLENLIKNKWIIIKNGNDLHKSSFQKNNIMTEYEEKWSKLGKNINFIFAKKPIK